MTGTAPAAGANAERLTGVVDSMPEDEYHAHPALSSTGARQLLPPSTPAKFRWLADHPQQPTEEMELGSALHAEILGVGPKWELAPSRRQSAADKAVVAEIRALGRIPLRRADAERVQAMAKAVREHPDAGPLLDLANGVAERSLFWTDPATGVECRARLDFWPSNGRYIADLKSVHSAAPSGLPKVVADRGYAIQDRWYCDGVQACGLADDTIPFIFVFVESCPPFGVTVARVRDADREWAARRAAFAREIYRDCTEAGIWPNYPPGIHTIRIPGWAKREEDNDAW